MDHTKQICANRGCIKCLFKRSYEPSIREKIECRAFAQILSGLIQMDPKTAQIKGICVFEASDLIYKDVNRTRKEY